MADSGVPPPRADHAPDGTPHHELLTNDHASAWLGITLVDAGHGTARLTRRVRREMLNGFGMIHGGMIFAFADSAFALACNPASVPDGGNRTVAAGADISFLSPVYEGELLTAVATRRASAGRSGLYDITVTADDDGTPRPVAEFRGRSRTIPAAGRPSPAKDES
ncbi:hotdog fold thioesterase [Arthrobacter sp. Br18]|uniref:hotdog fold thioesterase n=1 Tax=Arthrobacter sp. Br18 TaxID=1312954 RepID=UPI0004B3F022|nr:hotdog fold thioesterase [Arthrobacter sp. Br18]